MTLHTGNILFILNYFFYSHYLQMNANLHKIQPKYFGHTIHSKWFPKHKVVINIHAHKYSNTYSGGAWLELLIMRLLWVEVSLLAVLGSNSWCRRRLCSSNVSLRLRKSARRVYWKVIMRCCELCVLELSLNRWDCSWRSLKEVFETPVLVVFF